ncbi:retrovirus-related pol polyprotein from transposon TNT 1-94 [Tanacetum coccineum]
MEIARALRLHAHLPIHFWIDCVITATYLINRFPTTVLKFKTPYEVLLSNKPVYKHLRVFGCLAVASNPSRVADKFEARASPHETEQAPLNDNLILEPEFELVLVLNITLQPEATRKSTRVLVQPSWLKDYVIPRYPKANQVSVTSLQNQYHAFLCALVAQTTSNYFKESVKDADWKKVRLVINGNRQRKGVDYEDTFAPVVNIVRIKSILNVGSITATHIIVNAAQ